MRKIKKRIVEICEELDVDIYWKNCNFLENEEDDEIPTFYSRDEGSISFRELLLWYLPRIDEYQDELDCDQCNHEKCNNFRNVGKCEDYVLDGKIKDKHYSLFMELVDIYAYYTQRDYAKYKELKDKCKSVLEEIMS